MLSGCYFCFAPNRCLCPVSVSVNHRFCRPMLLPKLSAHYASSRARSSFKCLNMFDPIPHNVEQTQQCHQNKSRYLPFERIGLCQCWTYLVVSLKHDPYTFCNKRTLQSTILIFTTFSFGREHIATKKTEQRSWIAEYPETWIKPPAKDTKQPKQKSDNFGQFWATHNELQLVFASLSCLLLASLESRLAELVPPLPLRVCANSFHRISKSSKPTAQWFGAPGWLASGPTSRVHRMREIHKPHLKTTKTKKIQRKIDLWTRTNAQYNGPWGLAGSVLHVARWNVQRCLQRCLNI